MTLEIILKFVLLATIVVASGRLYATSQPKRIFRP